MSGGACVPPLLGKAADLNNSTAKAMCVPLAFFVAAWSYALCVNFVPAYRDPADQFHTTKVGVASGAQDEENSGENVSREEDPEKATAGHREDAATASPEGQKG